ncbi:phenylalanine--tRNA ligase subunit beta [Mesoplasma corruscae]|uniref:Phenylalanine--tRNA ligase beta subunit n=1 Tax=Mesoplasma corruscae TaxID=216874 RepID=A0A2S5RG35_9MOLU|nr:phenylalanine--tRNA ligase subunit beta [Mesoplasma corruscae]PPE06261.1 phenylalanyl-tRNA synthetase subunit beta [Mesoplasma corruscae]
MIITRKWLNKYLDLTNVTNAQIAIAFNSLGFEVEEEIDYSKFSNNKIVLGYIESVEQIPETNLKKTVTKIGANKKVTILSTARNIIANNYVVVALPGATLFNGNILDNRKMLGIVSEGMFCAYNEIAFSNNNLTEAEIVEIVFVTSLSKDLEKQLGNPIGEIIGLDDYAFDLDLTLNRSDALAGYQLVKELANYFDLEPIEYKNEFKYSKQTQKFNININKKVEQNINTISYSLVHLNENEFNLTTHDDILLKISKIKSNDNKFEQLANIATFKTGQPFILMDADKVTNDFEITNQKFDDKEILVLKNNKRLVNIIGLKTEKEFAVTNQTQRILVLMLNIDQIIMRGQLKKLNINNIDLQRYAKPLNKNLFNQGLIALLNVFSKYKILDFVENIEVVLKGEQPLNVYKTTLSRINQILGMEFTVPQIIDLFKHLDIKVTSKKDEITFDIDENRTDIYGEFDLCEEVARIYGYDNFDEKPLEFTMFNKTNNLERKLKNKVVSYFVGNGFNNIKSYSLTEKTTNKAWNMFDVKGIINVMSPLSIQRESYRTNLSKTMVETIIFNANNGNKNLKLFEVGDIFGLNEFRENHLCFAVSNQIVKDPITKVDIKSSYAYIQSYLIAILNFYKVNLKEVSFINKEPTTSDIHPFINIEVKYKNKTLAYIFKLNPAFEKANKIGETFVCEININAIYDVSEKIHKTNELSKFQKSYRNISMELSREQSYQDIVKSIVDGVKHLVSYEIVDIYADDQMKNEKKYSITFKFEFNSIDKQLTEQEISSQFNIILNRVKDAKVKIR